MTPTQIIDREIALNPFFKSSTLTEKVKYVLTEVISTFAIALLLNKACQTFLLPLAPTHLHKVITQIVVVAPLVKEILMRVNLINEWKNRADHDILLCWLGSLRIIEGANEKVDIEIRKKIAELQTQRMKRVRILGTFIGMLELISPSPFGWVEKIAHVFSAIFGGIGLCYIYDKYQKMALPILGHGIYNMISLYILLTNKDAKLKRILLACVLFFANYSLIYTPGAMSTVQEKCLEIYNKLTKKKDVLDN